MAAALGGLDVLVFTAGIGENDAQTRAEVVAGCDWLGLAIDQAANNVGGGCISPASVNGEVWVIPTDEERMIAEHALSLLSAGQRGP
jgi:acetate kinase